MPKISVIVPVYNLECEIKKCILSLIFQQFTDFEIIAIDDGSTDNSPLILDELAGKFPDLVRVFHRKNFGLSSSRNFGIKKSRGDFIAFVDGDDFVESDFLEKLNQSIMDHNSDIAVCGFYEHSNGKNRIFKTSTQVLSGPQAAKKLLTRQENLDVVCWNKIYRKTLFDAVNFPEDKNHEDNFSTYKLLFNAKKVSYVDAALYNYVRRENSITKKEATISRLKAKLSAAREAKKYFKSKNDELFSAAEFSEILAFFQFIDFSIKCEINQKYFSKFRQKVLEENVPLDFKRRFYLMLLIPFHGLPYKFFRKLTK
jgi:glycosyltransferase involved in cell wall biosynthesis